MISQSNEINIPLDKNYLKKEKKKKRYLYFT